MPSIFTPINPKTVAVSGVAANFAAVKQGGFITLTSTCDAFYLVSAAGTSATVDGNACHFIAAGQSMDLQVSPGQIVSIIANTGGSGNAYISEWA